MKKFYSFIAISLLGLATVANAANGTVSFQLDMNLGSGTPDLLEEETEAVEASYENGILTISQMLYGFNAIEFTVDLESGEVVAANQVATVEEGNPFYYYDVESGESELYGHVSNVGTDKCELVLQPWGPGDYYPGFGVFFIAAFYNTVFTFDFSIPGLGMEIEESVLQIESVDYETINSETGAYMEFTVAVMSENLPEGSETEVYYKGPYDNDYKEATENGNGTFEFVLSGLEPEQEYTVEVYAQAGNVISETEYCNFRFEAAGVSSLKVDEGGAKYFDLKGKEVKNPQNGEIYIKLNNGEARKVLIQ